MGYGSSVEMTFEFDVVRNFTALYMYSNNDFHQGVQVSVFFSRKFFTSINIQRYRGVRVIVLLLWCSVFINTHMRISRVRTHRLCVVTNAHQIGFKKISYRQLFETILISIFKFLFCIYHYNVFFEAQPKILTILVALCLQNNLLICHHLYKKQLNFTRYLHISSYYHIRLLIVILMSIKFK